MIRHLIDANAPPIPIGFSDMSGQANTSDFDPFFSDLHPANLSSPNQTSIPPEQTPFPHPNALSQPAAPQNNNSPNPIPNDSHSNSDDDGSSVSLNEEDLSNFHMFDGLKAKPEDRKDAKSGSAGKDQGLKIEDRGNEVSGKGKGKGEEKERAVDNDKQG